MTISDLYGLVGVLLVLAVSVFTISHGARRLGLHPELARKVLHVVMGLVTLSFPRIFSGIMPVLLLALTSSGFFLAVHRWHALASAAGLTDTALARSSRGEFYFILGVYFSLWLAPSPLAYTMAILVLTFADAAAAITGLYCGRNPILIPHGTKTLEGSVVFFLVAMLTTGWLLTTEGGCSGIQWWQITLSVALIATITEAVLTRGLDNLVIPIAVLFALQYLVMIPLPVLVLVGFIGLMLLFHGAGHNTVRQTVREKYV